MTPTAAGTRARRPGGRWAGPVVGLTLASLLATPAHAQTVTRRPGDTARAQNSAAASRVSLRGTVMTPDGQPLAMVPVRARSLVTGAVGDRATTDTMGRFTMTVPPGNYVVEVLDSSERVIGTSAFVVATAGSPLAPLTITVTTGGLNAASGSSGGLLGVLGRPALRNVMLVAGAAGVAAVVVSQDSPTASPSR